MLIFVCKNGNDELKIAERSIAACVEKTGQEAAILVYSSFPKMLFALEDMAARVDLIYMDVDELSGISGSNFAEILKRYSCCAEVIFMASCNERWQEGYDAGAIHFLLKEDWYNERFEIVFAVALKRIVKKHQNAMVLGLTNEKTSVPIADIMYFKSDGRIMRAYCSGDQEYEFYSRLSKIEDQLKEGFGFIRAHRSYLVNKTFIKTIKSTALILVDKTELPLSRTAASTLRKEISFRSITQVRVA